MRTVVTGAAGFIGSALTRRLLVDGATVIGVDNLSDYYDPQLKRDRLATFAQHPGFSFHEADLAQPSCLDMAFADPVDVVFHLAGQPGVRYSLEHPATYVDANVMGTVRVLEQCRHHKVGHLLYASSSSVYGANTQVPFSEHHPVDHPVSLYAATKRATELMAHSYSHLFSLPTTGLRFFTVYGPWGRPDMAIFKFADRILKGETIDIYNHGEMIRDFTYIDDVVECLVRLGPHPPNTQGTNDRPDTGAAPFRLLNVGHAEPVPLMHVIEALERNLGHVATKRMLPMQPGDLLQTSADTDRLRQLIDYVPTTSVDDGIATFCQWFLEYRAQQS